VINHPRATAVALGTAALFRIDFAFLDQLGFGVFSLLESQRAIELNARSRKNSFRPGCTLGTEGWSAAFG
jgi:hypothetical protein